ncbi:MAG: transcriptional regulator [Thermodesulfobacteriota bacterium]
MTIRKEMEALLSRGPMNARELSQALGITEKDVAGHLEHLAKSVAAQGGKLTVTPSECLECGFRFEKRERLNAPGRCPRCRGQRMSRPEYFIRT